MMKLLKNISFLLLLVFFGCGGKSDTNINKINHTKHIDLDSIKTRGKLVAITGYNAYSYFIYRGLPMGFEYDLVKRLADHLDLDLEIVVEKNISRMFEMLENGEGDLIAFNLTVTSERMEKVNFTHHHHTTKQVLVQRRPENWRRMMRHQIEREMIRSPFDLDGKTITVRHGSAYVQRLKNLMQETGIEINIVESAPDLSTEDLIEMVADKKIDFTVSDDNIAMLNQAYYSNIDIGTDISLPQKIAWAVRKDSDSLLIAINDWLEEMRSEPDYYAIYKKYYQNRHAFKDRLVSEFFSTRTGKISEYDELLKEYSKYLDWDWRIIASLMYQESRFDSDARSWAGAVGLMQLMPATAEQYGVKDLTDPFQNIEAGIKYLVWLDNYWKREILDKDERVKFVLASYNIGLGHIIDARALADKFGDNNSLWSDHVELYLLKKSKEKYYNDEVVKYGYAKGTETIAYVDEILERFDHYKQFVAAI